MRARPIVSALVAASFALSCTTTRYRAEFTPPSSPGSVDREAPFLKCHLGDGGVAVLQQWTIDQAHAQVRGFGIRYGAQRRVRAEGRLTIPFAEVVLFETNVPERIQRSNLAILAVTTGASLLMTTLCLIDPKACFGSCPTFYVQDGEDWSLAAEGFSSSIARVLEATDVDALGVADPPSARFVVRMKNEALETHVVRSVRLLSVPRPEGVRVLRASTGFWTARELVAPARCAAAEGDCLGTLAAADGDERVSSADADDLGTLETIELAFPETSGPAGLAIVARNSLLNTFVFYQVLAYMGRDAGQWMAALEAAGPEQVRGLDVLGAPLRDVEVEVRTSERGWVRAGAFSEVGPIARETQLVPLPDDRPDGDVQVRLRLGQGAWRIDAVQLASLGTAVEPVPLPPVRARREGRWAPEVRDALLDDARTVVTYPGDVIDLEYEVPNVPQELFLESRGYYYEWMRREWLRDENPLEVARALADPEGLLRRLAPEYKRRERTMERIFWQTRIGRGRR